MKTLAVITVLTAALLSAYLVAQADDPAAEVRCAEIAFSLALEHKDIEAFAAMIDDDARFIGNLFTPRRGRDEIIEGWAGFFTDDAARMLWRPQIIEVLQEGDLAMSRGPYRMRGTLQSGDEFESWGIFNSIWRRNQDGEWRIVFDAGFTAEQPLPDETRALIEDPAPACAG